MMYAQFRGSSYNKAPEALLELTDPAIETLRSRVSPRSELGLSLVLSGLSLQAPRGTPLDRTKMDMWALGCSVYQLTHGIDET